MRTCLAAGPGIDYDPSTGVIGTGTDCAEVRACLSAGPNVDYDPATGVIGAETNCAEVRTCISAGPGVDYDPATGVIGADISTTPGNNLTIDDDGLFVPTGAATVNVGCGIVGDGSASAPVAANTGAWLYACPVGTAGSDVYCDPATGQLKAEPRTRTAFQSNYEPRTFPNLAVPFPDDTPVATFCASITNPDPCRTALVVITQETDVFFILPAGAEAAAGQGSDEMWRVKNTGSTRMDSAHLTFSKLQRATVGPGGTLEWCYDVTMARGSNGATYHQIFSNIRFHLISQ
ncbi:hypothetical protein DIZ27_32900 [Streptomyces sp. NWU339]|uniref:hypothetical protein n=1 Tax=Streptomyces sp. NWU339 TaxID=2185284 RepID=UPI000D672DC7|nr:hypothetical protein [Streptomyces sp. NWU339]PWI06540.1 hypothetical protein DIZ27_32900 [Streptomyces sp. NWU339]